jgi:DNA polymerase V
LLRHNQPRDDTEEERLRQQRFALLPEHRDYPEIRTTFPLSLEKRVANSKIYSILMSVEKTKRSSKMRTDVNQKEKVKATAGNVAPLASPVCVGFPSPAHDSADHRLDLNKFLVLHPSATFFVRAEGNSMTMAGIHPGDILVVDRALKPEDNRVVIAILDGEFFIKRLRLMKRKAYLLADNPGYKPIVINQEQDFEVWGVATWVIHRI